MFTFAYGKALSLPQRPKHRCQPSVICSHKTLVVVPDHFAKKVPPWYRNLQAQLPNFHVHLLQMPNPYESNTKRWESIWLNIIHDSVQDSSGKVSLLGHGTGADACMRYLENHCVESGVVLVAPSGDEYFAAERHGRPYHWELIRANVGSGLVLVTSDVLDKTESKNLQKHLRPTLNYDMPAILGRYTEEDTAEELVKLINCANDPREV